MPKPERSFSGLASKDSKSTRVVVSLSPSAKAHHTYGWLTNSISVIDGNDKPEEWRIGAWENVDVRRYISKRRF